ncbi:phosphatase inhibitor-domain-containing protein [Trametes elegans]|nr:phosphatase inhibitor-domain-containing protein [Trametes elegans]
MATRMMRRPGTSAPSDGSRTITVEDNQPREETSQSEAESSTVGTLRLRGAPRNRQRVVWREDVVDNEGAGKKKTKICCIYHKPKRFDESSSSDDSSDESDSDSSCDSRVPRRRGHDHNHDHDEHAENGGHGAATRDRKGGGVVHELESDSDDVNAYERMPRRKPNKGKNKSS